LAKKRVEKVCRTATAKIAAAAVSGRLAAREAMVRGR
jgi:hypothetical protein